MRRTIRRGYRGIVLIWVAIFVLLLIGFVAIAIDAAYMMVTANQLQNAADASALAGALEVRADTGLAHQAALDVAAMNAAAGDWVLLAPNVENVASGDVVIGRFDITTKQFTATLSSPNAVQVKARRNPTAPGGPVPLFFGPLFGVNAGYVTRPATAITGGPSGIGVIALNLRRRGSFSVVGTSTFQVVDLGIHVNSDNDKAVGVNGTVTLIASELNVVGDTFMRGTFTFDGELNTDANVKPDPLADLPVPPWETYPNRGTIKSTGGTIDLQPGYYPGGITVTGGQANFAPGIYAVDGAGLNITGNSSMYAYGVMFYVKGTGKLDVSGTGDIILTPPDRTDYTYPGADTYHGVSIFQERTSTNQARMIGTTLTDLNGIIYVKSGEVEVGGTAGTFGCGLVADTIYVHGTGTFTIEADDRYPIPSHAVYLVW